MKRTDKRTKRILALLTFLPRYANGILSKEKTTSLVILCCLLFCQHAFSQEPLKKITIADSIAHPSEPIKGYMAPSYNVEKHSSEAFSPAQAPPANAFLPAMQQDSLKVDVGLFTPTLLKWQNGYIEGAGSVQTMMGLMDKRSGGFNVYHNFGQVQFAGQAFANQYWMYHSLERQLGFRGLVTVGLSAQTSITFFGQYVDNPFFRSMASMPFVDNSVYGGYFSIKGEKIGLNVGAQRVYDAFSRTWRTDPIIMPTFKIGNQRLGIDFGNVAGGVLRHIINKRH